MYELDVLGRGMGFERARMAPKSYEVSILPRAMKELGAIPPRDHEAVIEAILELAGNPRPRGTKKLRGGDLWRLRVGAYRVLTRFRTSA